VLVDYTPLSRSLQGSLDGIRYISIAVMLIPVQSGEEGAVPEWALIELQGTFESLTGSDDIMDIGILSKSATVSRLPSIRKMRPMTVTWKGIPICIKYLSILFFLL
jgi:hypothetical protein